MSFARGMTPTITITFSATKYPTLDLTTASLVRVTFSSGIKKFSKEGDSLVVGTRSIGVFLTQQETLQFGAKAEVQANWLTADGKRGGSKVIEFEVGRQLEDKVMTND